VRYCMNASLNATSTSDITHVRSFMNPFAMQLTFIFPLHVLFKIAYAVNVGNLTPTRDLMDDDEGLV